MDSCLSRCSCPSTNVFIESGLSSEGIRHVSHSPSTPLGDIAVLTGVTISKPISNRRVKVTIRNGSAGWNTATSKRTAVVSELSPALQLRLAKGSVAHTQAEPFHSDNLIGLAGGWGRG